MKLLKSQSYFSDQFGQRINIFSQNSVSYGNSASRDSSPNICLHFDTPWPSPGHHKFLWHRLLHYSLYIAIFKETQYLPLSEINDCKQCFRGKIILCLAYCIILSQQKFFFTMSPIAVDQKCGPGDNMVTMVFYKMHLIHGFKMVSGVLRYLPRVYFLDIGIRNNTFGVFIEPRWYKQTSVFEILNHSSHIITQYPSASADLETIQDLDGNFNMILKLSYFIFIYPIVAGKG